MIAARAPRTAWRQLALISAFTLIVTALPYLIGATRTDAAWQFSGFVFGVEDGNSYLGKMRLGMRGQFAFHLFYTPEIHAAAPLINLPYIAVGWIAGLFVPESDPRSHAALTAAFHAFRLVADALLIVAVYRFGARFIAAPRARRIALLLALFGGGIGWLLALIGQSNLFGSLPADLYIPEGFSFQVLFGLPHLALARAALLTGFVLLTPPPDPLSTAFTPPPDPLPTAWRGGAPTSPLGTRARISPSPYRREGWGVRSMLAGLCWLVVGVIVPFYLAVIYVVLGAWGLATWIRTRRFPLALALTGGAAALIAFPAFAYNAVVFAGNPAFAVWSAQNVLTSPHPLHYVFAYAVIGLAAAFGVRAVWRRTKDDARWLLPLAWVAIVPLLVYLPINIQRRLSEAVIVPLAVLAVVGLQKLSSPSDPFSLSERGRTPRLPIVFLAVVSLSAAFLWLGGMVTALSPRAPAFIPAAYAAAFAWLNAPDGANVQPDDVILASVPMGNALPAYMRARVYMGHGPETLFWGAKTDIVERFYGGDLSDVELSALFVPPCPAPDDAATGRGLCLLPVRYVVYGDMERALEITPMPNDAMPAWADGLTRVYDLDGVQIYAAD